LLYALGSLDPCGSKVIKFYIMDVRPLLPYHVDFQIHVEYMKITIKCTKIDEGVVMCVISLTCWKDIGSLALSQSMTMLTKNYGCSFQPHKIIPTFLF